MLIFGVVGPGPHANRRFELILKRAKEIWYAAEHPVRAAALRAGPYQEVMIGGYQGPLVEPSIDRILELTDWNGVLR